MSKKHSRGYVPQQRKAGYRQIVPVTQTEVVHNQDGSEEVITQEVAPVLEGYDELYDIMQVEDGVIDETSNDIPNQWLQQSTAGIAENVDAPSEDDVRLSALLAAKTLVSGIDYVKTMYGVDLLANPERAKVPTRQVEMGIALSLHAARQRQLQDGSSYEKQLTTSAAMTVFTVLAMSNSAAKRIGSRMINYPDASDLTSSIIEGQALEKLAEADRDEVKALIGPIMAKLMMPKRVIMEGVTQSPANYRKRQHGLLSRLARPEMREFVNKELEKFEGDWLSWVEEGSSFADSSASGIEIEGGQILDYSILPEGTNLKEFTEKVCDGLSESDKPYVDLRRVAVLESLREIFGADSTYYVHGKSRGEVLDETGTPINEAYIGLVIQHHDRSGSVKAEDAVVISPVAKRHAGYFYRHDAEASKNTSWRTVLALPKHVARDKGARPLKFTNVSGQDKYEAYIAKALELLTCPATSFGSDYGLSRTKSGEYVMRKRTIKTVEQAFEAISGPF